MFITGYANTENVFYCLNIYLTMFSLYLNSLSFTDIPQEFMNFAKRNEKKKCIQEQVRVVKRYMGSGIKGRKKGGIRDHSPGIWDHNPRDRDQQCFSLDQGSGVLDQQNFAG